MPTIEFKNFKNSLKNMKTLPNFLKKYNISHRKINNLSKFHNILLTKSTNNKLFSKKYNFDYFLLGGGTNIVRTDLFTVRKFSFYHIVQFGIQDGCQSTVVVTRL
jgi:hypothetical protein